MKSKSMTYQYTPSFRVKRINAEDGSKRFCMQRLSAGRWIRKRPEEHLPLYQVDQTAGADIVWIVEGEKCAEACKSLALAATTSAMGAKNPSQSDWSPLRGRRVIILPDNDADGRSYAIKVGEILLKLDPGADVSVLLLPDLEPSGDIADWIEQRESLGHSMDQIGSEITQLTAQAQAYAEWAPHFEAEVEGRNNRLMSLAGKWRREGATEEEILDRLLHANASFERPLAPDEVASVARSAARYPAARARREIPPSTPFPVDALPEPVAGYVTAAAAAIGCDPAYVALPMLAVAGAAIGTTRRIRIKNSWTEYPVIWALIVGRSGTHKSPALDAALRFTRQAEEQSGDEHTTAMADYASEQAEFERAEAAWRKSGRGEERPAESPRPRRQRWMCSDVTIEALAEILADNPRGLLVCHDEAAAWFGSHGRYASGAGRTESATWIQLFTPRPLTVDRKTGDRRVVDIPLAAVSITGTIQPGALRRVLGDEQFENGLASRFLFAMPLPRQRVWSEDTVPDAAIRAVEKVLRRLRGLESEIRLGSERSPVERVMDEPAKEVWRDFFDSHGQEITASDDHHSAALSKLEAYAARIALIFHEVTVAQQGNQSADSEIGVSALANAIRVVHWCKDETKRIYAMLGDPEVDESAALVDMIAQSGGRITPDELRRRSRRFAKNKLAESALSELVKRGAGLWSWRETTSRGGRPTREFCLNSPVCESAAHPGDDGTAPKNKPAVSVRELWDRATAIRKSQDAAKEAADAEA